MRGSFEEQPAGEDHVKVAIAHLQPEAPNFWEIIPAPRYGTPVVATALRDAGFDVTCLVEGISRDLVREIRKADIVGFTILSATADRTYSLADGLRREGKTVIFGGTHANYFLDDSLEHCDFVVLGDAEGPLVELVRALAGKKPFEDISGIAWRERGKTRLNPIIGMPSRFDGITDLQLVKDYPAFLRRHPYAPIVFQATRGCPRGCRFCVTGKMFGDYACRDVDAVVADLTDKLRYTRNIYFVDNNFGADLEYAERLLNAMVAARIRMNAVVYVCQDFSRQTRLLALMREVGFTRILIGIESPREESMRALGKTQSLESVRQAVAAFKEQGFMVSASFIMGAADETADEASRYLEVAEELGLDYAYFFVFSVYPEQCDELVRRDRVFLDDYRYATGHFVMFFGDRVRPSVLQRIVAETNVGFYSRRKIVRQIIGFNWKRAVELAFHRRLYRRLARAARVYSRKLETLERGLYAGNRLIPSALASRPLERLRAYDERTAYETRATARKAVCRTVTTVEDTAVGQRPQLTLSSGARREGI